MSSPPQQTFITGPPLDTKYPLIDNDPHFKRVVRYARREDYMIGTAAALAGPISFWLMEKLAPTMSGRRTIAGGYRGASILGMAGGFLLFYQRSSLRFYGMTENSREVDMDMREMVDKVKRGQPLYGETSLSPYLQGVAARQSRYSATYLDIIPWFNFVNHSQHGVDTSKYYRQAEKELEQERSMLS